MSDWQPTPELRFVTRVHQYDSGLAETRQILQQKWSLACADGDADWWTYEWRDVPLVGEE
jgi:hypothetical protein